MECNFENCPNFERLGKKFADKISELEQENAELKAYKDVNEDFKTAWEELKAENDRLRTCLEMQRTDETNQYTKKVNIERKNYKLKQTLQEIKEICKNSYTSASEDYYRTADKILQKINEVIGAEELYLYYAKVMIIMKHILWISIKLNKKH